MTMGRKGAWGAAALAALLLIGPAAAGAAEKGPLRLAQANGPDDGDPGGADAGDVSAMVVRIGRLESQIRTLTGQIEQLQFQNRKLSDDLRKMQGDVDFRFQDLKGGAGAAAPAPARPPAPLKRGDADGAAPGGVAALATPALPATAPPMVVADETTGGPAARPRVPRGGDAFDPASDPTAPGAPRPLGTTAPSPPLPGRVAAAEPQAPLDLMRRPGAAEGDADAPAVIAAPPAARDPNALASLAPGGTREEYEADLALYRQGQYDGAAAGFQSFAGKYPRDRLVPEAVYLAGESYARLGRHREAAEQFLKVSTDYAKSSRAPDALLRLGVSLNALGAHDQACATYQEVTRRYPGASADVRAGVDRELKRARCPGNG